jgi:hypothetical protein
MTNSLEDLCRDLVMPDNLSSWITRLTSKKINKKIEGVTVLFCLKL